MQAIAQANDYRVEKDRVQVVLVTVAGERIAGEVFVQPFTMNHRGPEEVIDLLNGPDPFFPLRCADGAIRFFLKERVLEAELADNPPDDDARRACAREAQVEVSLAPGISYRGSISYEVPSSRPRLLDYLNRLDRRFLQVHTGDGCRLVNWRLMDSLRPLD